MYSDQELRQRNYPVGKRCSNLTCKIQGQDKMFALRQYLRAQNYVSDVVLLSILGTLKKYVTAYCVPFIIDMFHMLGKLLLLT